MIKFDKTNYAKNLPDKYHKATDGNNDKILRIERLPITRLKGDTETTLNSLDLNKSTGKTLDLYGEMIGQPRGLATDEQYITMIHSKITQYLSGGNYPSVLNAICATFQCDPSEVLITELEAPLAIEITSLPISAINKAGFTVEQIIAFFKRVLPIGGSVETLTFAGTFEFSDDEFEASTAKGFRNDENDDTQGGYFGEVYSSDNGVDLPI